MLFLGLFFVVLVLVLVLAVPRPVPVLAAPAASRGVSCLLVSGGPNRRPRVHHPQPRRRKPAIRDCAFACIRQHRDAPAQAPRDVIVASLAPTIVNIPTDSTQRSGGGARRLVVPGRMSAVRQTSPFARLFHHVIWEVVSFLPSRDLAALNMVCRFFAMDYGDKGMCLSEAEAQRRFPRNIFRGVHQSWVRALNYYKTFQGPCTRGYYNFRVHPVSTIALSFSCDKRHFASSHGDHSVKIIDFMTGELKQELVGHPRTPWSVKFHPTKPNIVASGCLGSQVFLWDTNTGERLAGVRVDSHVLSLAFHPGGSLIAIACTENLQLWDCSSVLDPRGSSAPSRLVVYRKDSALAKSMMPHPHQAVRCVLFHPNGKQVIIGKVPPPMHRTGVVKLELWDYDASKRLAERISSPKVRVVLTACPHPLSLCVNDWPSTHLLLTRLLLLSSLSFVFFFFCICPPVQLLCRSAHLYSDGGIDISSCGNFIVTLTKGVSQHHREDLTKLCIAFVSIRPETCGQRCACFSLNAAAAKHVTSVKLSRSKNFLLLGTSSVGACVYGLRVEGCGCTVCTACASSLHNVCLTCAQATINSPGSTQWSESLECTGPVHRRVPSCVRGRSPAYLQSGACTPRLLTIVAGASCIRTCLLGTCLTPDTVCNVFCLAGPHHLRMQRGDQVHQRRSPRTMTPTCACSTQWKGRGLS